MRPETIVSDTGPVFHLHEANALDLLQSAARLEALFSSSLWVSSSVREDAREALNQILASS